MDKKTGASKASGLRLVHHKPASPREGRYGCQYNEDVVCRDNETMITDAALDEFVGPGGLVDLTAMLSDGFTPAEEVLEMIKRLHVPGYEHARKFFKAAISDGAFEPNTKPGYHSPQEIAATLKWMDDNDY
ncbi:MAG TPA: hypothetical protein VGH20_06380 [Myxococcales bacterium]|jgi:hypothetical protein